MLGFSGNNKPRGTSLVEIMIAVSIVSIAFLAMINVFGSITRSIMVSKAKTLATNLAQEKIQILKQYSYLRLMVTPYVAYNSNFSPAVPYDNTYYLPEEILEGTIHFTRYTYINTAAEVGTGLSYFGPSFDTGMKLITVTVTWTEKNQHNMVQLSSVYANPDTVKTNGSISGRVYNTTPGVALTGANIVVAENNAWQDNSDASGDYRIDIFNGAYNIVASKRGFFTQNIARTIAPYQSITQDFTLVRMASGTVTGDAWINDHFVISQIVASSVTVDGFDQEYIELYNPTTSYIRIVNGMVASPYDFVYQESGQPQQSIMMQFAVMDSSIPPNSFFLMANTTTINVFNGYLDTDAVYMNPPPGSDVIKSPEAGGFGIRQTDWMTGILTWIDQVGWTRNPGTGMLYPSIYEGSAISQVAGFTANEQYVRYSRTTSPYVLAGYGRAYDTNKNSDNFVDEVDMQYPPYNKGTTAVPLAATPAFGAIVACNDGLSIPTVAVAVGAPYPRAEFKILEVATGTWSVFISSYAAPASFYREVSSVTLLTDGQVVSIPNAVTDPEWPAASYNSVFLSSVPTGGFISGRITNTSGLPISPRIPVKFLGWPQTAMASESTGRYLMELSTGIYSITANPPDSIYANVNYVSQTQDNIAVEYGQMISTGNFVLSQGGRAYGFITRDGINHIPHVAVIANNDSSGFTAASGLSDAAGKFTFYGLPVADYNAVTVLDTGEKSAPVEIPFSITQGCDINIGTFTVTDAFGKIKGTVRKGPDVISTGVLIVASTESFTVPPAVLSGASATNAPYYFTNSYEDGTYVLEVRGSTQCFFTMQAYLFTVSPTGVTIDRRPQLNIPVTPGTETTGVNFTW